MVGLRARKVFTFELPKGRFGAGLEDVPRLGKTSMFFAFFDRT